MISEGWVHKKKSNNAYAAWATTALLLVLTVCLSFLVSFLHRVAEFLKA
jgi:hypothetical protein